MKIICFMIYHKIFIQKLIYYLISKNRQFTILFQNCNVEGLINKFIIKSYRNISAMSDKERYIWFIIANILNSHNKFLKLKKVKDIKFLKYYIFMLPAIQVRL